MSSFWSFYSYFTQFTWSFSLGQFLAMCLPFYIYLLLGNPFFMSSGLMETAFTWSMLTMAKFFLKGPFSRKAGSVHLLVFLFSILFMMNALGSIPFLSSVSTNPSVVFFYAFFFWSMGTLGSLVSKEGFLSGLWVKGAPFSLNLVVVVSELLSWLIRPVVLGVRLLVNAVCGHIMMSIVGEMSAHLLWEGHWILMLISATVGCLIGLLEFLIALVQAMIFVGLVSWSWSSSPKATRSFSYWCLLNGRFER